jgi:hypothetical protein
MQYYNSNNLFVNPLMTPKRKQNLWEKTVITLALSEKQELFGNKGFEMPLASPRSKPHLLHRFLKTFCGLLNNGCEIILPESGI